MELRLLLTRHCCSVTVFFCKNWKTSAVSTTDWMVEAKLCKVRDTSDTFFGRAYVFFFYKKLKNVSCRYDRSILKNILKWFLTKLKNVGCEYDRWVVETVTVYRLPIRLPVSERWLAGSLIGGLKTVTKLRFASFVIRQTRSLGALVLLSIRNMVFVNYIYDWYACW